jgi:putative oxidoreductase
MKTQAPLIVTARVLLALMFILAGFSKFANLSGTAGYIASQGLPLPQVAAFGAATLEVLGGIALALGLQARWAAGALAAFTLVATVVFHAFWAMPAEQAFVNQLMFMKNLAVIGGLLLVVSFGAGPASIDARLAPRRLAAA